MSVDVLIMIFGASMMVMATSFLVDSSRLENLKKEIIKSVGLSLIFGLIPWVIGLFLMSYYLPMMALGWKQSLMAIIGVLMVIGGLIRVVFMGTWHRMMTGSLFNRYAGPVLVMVLVLGMALCVIGFQGYWMLML